MTQTCCLLTWAARYYTRLLIQLMPKGLVLSFPFFSFLFISFLSLAYGCLSSCRPVPASLRMCVSRTTWVCLLMATAIRLASIGFGPMVVRQPFPPYCSRSTAPPEQSYASQSLTRFSSFIMGRTWGVFRSCWSPQELHTFNIFTRFLKM